MIKYTTIDVDNDDDMLEYLAETPTIVTSDIDETLDILEQVYPELSESSVEVYTVSSDTLECFFDLAPFDRTVDLYMIRIEDLDINAMGIISVIEMAGYSVMTLNDLILEYEKVEEAEEDY